MKTRNVHIDISKSDVFGRVRVKASYLASKSILTQGAGAYDQIEIADADSILTDKQWKEACSSLTALTENYAELVEVGDDKYTAVLRMPLNFDDRKEALLNEMMAEYIVNDMLSKWCAVASKSDAEYYLTVTAGMMSDMRSLLATRLRPMRRERTDDDPERIILREGDEI